MKKTIYSLIAAAGVLASCSSEPITANKGESFVFNDQNITIDFSSASILSNDDEKTTLIAPEGKVYLKLDIKAEEDNYFLSLKDGETEVEEVDYLWAKPFLEKSDDMFDPNKQKLYLVDMSNTNYKVEVKSFGDDLATLAVGQLNDEKTIELNASMLSFVNAFANGARLSEVMLKYLPEGAVIYDYLTETGMDVSADPIVKALEIEYVVDNNTYECSSEFGVEKMKVTWSGNMINKVVFE